MNLRTQAAADLRQILQDVDGGFAVSIRITSPYLKRATFSGFYRRIELMIDPVTGEQQVSTGQASVVIPLNDLKSAGMRDLRNEPDSNKNPWIIRVTEQSGEIRDYKVVDTAEDELGAVTCKLEAIELA